MNASASPLTFKHLPSGRVQALLGDRVVGEVVPFPYGGRAKAYWRMLLPIEYEAPKPKPASSIEIGVRALGFAIEEWFAGAGEEFSDLVLAMRRARQ